MQVGCLGDIIFEVSGNNIKTIDKATWSGSASIQSHERHLNNALQEFTGIKADEFSFSILLSAYLGVNPQSEIDKIFAYERDGIALCLTIGSKSYGKDLWLIKSHKVVLEHYDSDGDLTSATVNISLVEYLREQE